MAPKEIKIYYFNFLNGSHDFFQIFRIFFSNYFIKNPQTTMALTFLTHIISEIGGVTYYILLRVKTGLKNLWSETFDLNNQ